MTHDQLSNAVAVAVVFVLTSCGEEPYAFDFYVHEIDRAAPGERGAPIEGVYVAIDLGTRLEQAVTGSDGSVHIEVPASVEEITITAAKDGYLPVGTIYRATLAEIENDIARSGALYVVMAPARPIGSAWPWEPAPVTVTSFNSAHVPFCASTSVWDVCTGGGDANSASTPAARSADPLRVVAYSTDARGCPVELLEVVLPDALTDRSVELVFDGTGRTDPTLVDIAVRLPDDRSSSLWQIGMYKGARFPLIVQDPAETRIIGGACNKRPSTDGTNLEMTIAWFAEPDVRPIFDLAFLPNTRLPEGNTREFSFQRLPGAPEPGATYAVMDMPRMSTQSSRPTLASTFASQAVVGAVSYELLVVESFEGVPGRVLWRARSFRHQPITLPPLPDAYDVASQWPATTEGFFRLGAFDDAVVAGGVRSHALDSPARGCRESRSAAIPGALVR
ncbi:MAG: hypothetical protein IT379_10930 [Deltaproteobacteria bacterium]|nr:hypothetical protein [Deltaproteobacteria bacterium]